MSDDRCHRCDRAECRADDLRRLWQAASSGSDEEARAGLALDAANADCRAHEVTREQWRTRALTAEREAERLRHGTTIEVTAEQIVDAWDAAAGGPYSLPSAAVRAAVERFIGARIVAAKNAPPSGPTPTTFECRVCSRQVGGMSDGAFDEQGWSRIERIDGPDAICPTCIADPTALDGLREEYPHAKVRAALAQGADR